MTNEFRPDYIVPPGETIRETMEYLGLSEEGLAEQMDYDIEFVANLLAGNTPLTRTVAERLECVLGVPGIMWLNLEASYQKGLANEQHPTSDA